MKIGDHKEAEGFISEINTQLRNIFNWQFFTSFVFLYSAYLVAYSPGCYLLGGIGMVLLVATYRNSVLVMHQEGRAVLITGCDSGYGFELAKKLHAKKFTVFAGCLDVKSNGAMNLKRCDNQAGRLHIIQMDVTNQEDIDSALQYVKEHLSENGLWGIVNNADKFSCPGFLEWSPVETYEKVMSVNLFGAIRLTNSFLPLIRKSGRIVNVSSLLTHIPSTFNGPYAMAKNAIDSYSTVLRVEMKRFNVRVIVIEPGNFLTEGANLDSIKSDFTRTVRRMWDLLDDGLRLNYGETSVEQQIDIGQLSLDLSEKDISSVVDAMAKAILLLHPKDRYVIAPYTEKLVAYGMQYLPLWLTDRLVPTMEAQTYLSYLSYIEPFIMI